MFASDETDFAEVQIITLKQWVKECAYDRAWSKCKTPVLDCLSEQLIEVEAIAQRLLTTEFTHAQEFVKISNDLIQVGLDVPEINDDAIDKAVMLLSEAENLQPGNMYKFGKQVKISGT